MSTDPACHSVNGTDPCVPASDGSSLGLAVGLPLLFLALGVCAGLLVYRKRRRLIDFMELKRRKAQNRDEQAYVAHGPSEQLQRPPKETAQSDVQTAIYENLSVQPAGQRPSTAFQDRSPSEPEEDLYLQCDAADDVIYSNDVECSLAILPDSHGEEEEEEEEDLYVVPDPV